MRSSLPTLRQTGWRLCAEAAILAVAGCLLGLAINAFSPQPVPLSMDGNKPPWVDERIAMLTMEQAVEKYNQGAVFIDARTADEYLQRHIRNAIHIDAELPGETMLERLQFFPPDTEIVTYCDDFKCGSSLHLAEELIDTFKYTNVAVFKPGWSAWVQQDMPVDEGDAAMEALGFDLDGGGEPGL